MAVRTDFAAGEVLAAQDLDDTFAAKANLAGATYTGTHNFSGATITGVPQGLALVTTGDFSGVSSVNINNVFAANGWYRLVVDLAPSGTSEINLRMRASGSDYTGSGYDTARYSIFSNQIALTTQTTDKAIIGNMSGQSHFIVDIGQPFPTVPTRMLYQAGRQTEAFGGSHVVNTSTSYDGLTMYLNSGTMTGRYRIYRYQD